MKTTITQKIKHYGIIFILIGIIVSVFSCNKENDALESSYNNEQIKSLELSGIIELKQDSIRNLTQVIFNKQEYLNNIEMNTSVLKEKPIQFLLEFHVCGAQDGTSVFVPITKKAFDTTTNSNILYSNKVVLVGKRVEIGYSNRH